MKIGVVVFGMLLILGWCMPFQSIAAENQTISSFSSSINIQQSDEVISGGKSSSSSENKSGDTHHNDPAPWSVLPFIILLAMIATGPLFYAHFWHRYYPVISILLGIFTVVYYLVFLHDFHHPVHSLAEYISFIALITALFVASGGILIKVDKEGTPFVNVILLLFGAVTANIIGTTGASILLIRPFIRLNENRIKPYHIIFFIFIISNVGGSLTPIGDPPLFLGFLKGVPFFWTISNLWIIWLTGIGMLSAIFFFIDKRNLADYDGPDVQQEYSGKIEVKGTKNIIWLAIIIGSVFLDPAVFDWVPAIQYDEETRFSFLREVIMFGTAILAFRFADETCLKGNEFNFEPIREVAFLFVGIFATMMPALQLIGSFAYAEGRALVNVHTLYWATGSLSGILDNAPTYLNFLAAGMGKASLDINSSEAVKRFVDYNSVPLMSISIAAVFFGAMTYIGNAPNFMVKTIAEQVGIEMPAFIGYIVKYSIPFLVPVLIITWIIYFIIVHDLERNNVFYFDFTTIF